MQNSILRRSSFKRPALVKSTLVDYNGTHAATEHNFGCENAS